MKTNPDDLAMPSHQAMAEINPNIFDMSNQISGGGLTKREYFAATALGELTKYYDACAVGPADVAALAVQMADVLIEELNKEKDK